MTALELSAQRRDRPQACPLFYRFRLFAIALHIPRSVESTGNASNPRTSARIDIVFSLSSVQLTSEARRWSASVRISNRCPAQSPLFRSMLEDLLFDHEIRDKSASPNPGYGRSRPVERWWGLNAAFSFLPMMNFLAEILRNVQSQFGAKRSLWRSSSTNRRASCLCDSGKLHKGVKKSIFQFIGILRRPSTSSPRARISLFRVRGPERYPSSSSNSSSSNPCISIPISSGESMSVGKQMGIFSSPSQSIRVPLHGPIWSIIRARTEGQPTDHIRVDARLNDKAEHMSAYSKMCRRSSGGRDERLDSLLSLSRCRVTRQSSWPDCS